MMKSRLKFWFLPVSSGDFRLEKIAGDDDHVLLTVEDPTDADRKLLTPFFKTMKEMDMLVGMPEARISLYGRTEIKLRGKIEDIGPLLADKVHEDAKLWTAVRHVGGVVSVLDGNGSELFKQLPAKQDASNLPAKQEPEAVATVREPRRGCPPPETARRRASEVLRTFSTARQMEQWERHGAMKVIGNQTGKAYWLHHRASAVAHGLRHLLVEAVTGHEICIWDDRVPAEEEALAMKLAVEHREEWATGGPVWAGLLTLPPVG